jgi:hypothetical protein
MLTVAHRLVLAVMLPVLPVAPTAPATQQSVVAGQVVLSQDAHYHGATLNAYASRIGVTYYYNLASDNFFLDDEVSSVAMGGIRRTTLCRVVLYRDHDLAGPKLVLGYQNAANNFYVKSTGTILHHVRIRGDLAHSHFDNGQNANDAISSFTIHCISERV